MAKGQGAESLEPQSHQASGCSEEIFLSHLRHRRTSLGGLLPNPVSPACGVSSSQGRKEGTTSPPLTLLLMTSRVDISRERGSWAGWGSQPGNPLPITSPTKQP